MNRKIRRSIDIGLTILGIVIIFSAFLFENVMIIQLRFLLVLLGILFMEAGIWSLSSRILPTERRFFELRDEGDHMLELIRELHASAVAKDKGEEDAKRFQDTLAEMHESVELMSQLAGEKN